MQDFTKLLCLEGRNNGVHCFLRIAVSSAQGWFLQEEKGGLSTPEKCLSVCFHHSPLLPFIFQNGENINLINHIIEYLKAYILLMCRHHLDLLSSHQQRTLQLSSLYEKTKKAFKWKTLFFPLFSRKGREKPSQAHHCKKATLTALFSIWIFSLLAILSASPNMRTTRGLYFFLN